MKLSDYSELFKLCYIDGSFAFFTTQSLKDQWGDDWNDAPYEHNAGEPYLYNPETDAKPFEVLRIAFDGGELRTPGDLAGYNSSYSVQDINDGKVPWLQSFWTDEIIWAGSGLAHFAAKIERANGQIFLPYKND